MERDSQENKSISGTSPGSRTGISPDAIAANRNLPNGTEQGNTIGSHAKDPEEYQQDLMKGASGVQPDDARDK